MRHTFYKWKPQSDIYHDKIVEGSVSISDKLSTINNALEENGRTVNLERSKQKHVPAIESKSNFTKSEAYNGGTFDNYCWSQTITDVDITVQATTHLTKKNISLEILPSSILVKLSDGTILLEGELCEKCKSNDVIWSLDKNKLQIHIEKCQETWWNCLVKNEDQLDISKIDCTRPYDELSDEAQSKIEELQWNQQRKTLGLPTSNELVLHDKLKQGWNTEGSPFNGPFDSSVVKFN